MSNVDNLITEARSLETQFNAGQLSGSEYKELLEDLKSTKVIEVSADDLALQGQLNQLINGLIAVAGAA